MVGGLLQHDLIHGMLKSQCNVQTILREHKDLAFMPQSVANAFACDIDDVFAKIALLANIADEAGHCIWNIAPKYHYLCHMGQKAMFHNPTRGNCMLVIHGHLQDTGSTLLQAHR